MALAIGSVALMADSVDFLEDTAVNLLVLAALGWSLAARARIGKVMALVILVPAAAAVWQAVTRAVNGAVDGAGDLSPPDPLSLLLTAGGAVAVNSVAAWLLVRVRDHGGSMGHAAWVAARNDVVVNVLIIVMAAVTVVVGNGWPDLVLGVVVVVINGWAAHEVWKLAEEERLAAKALAGESLD